MDFLVLENKPCQFRNKEIVGEWDQSGPVPILKQTLNTDFNFDKLFLSNYSPTNSCVFLENT